MYFMYTPSPCSLALAENPIAVSIPFNTRRVIMTKFFSLGKTMRIFPFFLSALLLVSLSQCVSYDFSRRIVQQGNLFPASKINRLKIGMRKSDAAILMGTSLISPLFNQDRWDYAYTWRKGSGPLEIHRVSLYFVHGLLAKIEA